MRRAYFLANGLGTPATPMAWLATCDPSIGGLDILARSAASIRTRMPFAMLFPISRSVYNGLQMKLVDNVTNSLQA